MYADQSTWPLIRFGVIKDAWRLYKQHAMIWSLAMLIVMAANGAVNGVLHAALEKGQPLGPGGFRLFLPATGAARFIASTMVSGFLLGGMVRMASHQLAGRAPRLEDLFSITDRWFDLLLVSFLIGVATSIGMVPFVIPAFIVSGLCMLAIPLVAIGGLPATGAIIQSYHALKSQWLTASVFHWALIIVAVSGMILCGFGVLFTGPLYSLAVTILYQNFFGSGPVETWKKQSQPIPEI